MRIVGWVAGAVLGLISVELMLINGDPVLLLLFGWAFWVGRLK